MRQAFAIWDRGFSVRAFYTDSADAHVVVTRNGQPFKAFDYPAYRIWNVAAHFADMVDEFLTPTPDARRDG